VEVARNWEVIFEEGKTTSEKKKKKFFSKQQELKWDWRVEDGIGGLIDDLFDL